MVSIVFIRSMCQLELADFGFASVALDHETTLVRRRFLRAVIFSETNKEKQKEKEIHTKK